MRIAAAVMSLSAVLALLAVLVGAADHPASQILVDRDQSGEQSANADSTGATVIRLGTLPGDQYSVATCINDHGQVAGYSYSNTGRDEAFLYSNGRMTGLGTLGVIDPTWWSRAYGINSAGDVVGSSYSSEFGIGRAVLYSDGSITDLGALGGNISEAFGINDSGQVVGYSETANGEKHAFLYENGEMQDLGTLLPEGWDSQAVAINASGQIVGNYLLPETQYRYRPFLYSNGQLTDLGTFGGLEAYARAINDSGQIVGWYTSADGKAQHAFLYSDGTFVDLGTLGGGGIGDRSYATSINASGQIVGQSYGTDASGKDYSTCFLYSDGVMTDLNSLIATRDRQRIGQAYGINNTGGICGFGGLAPDKRTVALPRAWLLLGAASTN